MEKPDAESSDARSQSEAATFGWRAAIGAVEVLFGIGRRAEITQLVRELDCGRVLLVTDPGIAAAGHVEQMEADLDRVGLHFSTFDRVDENPTTQQVADGVAHAAPFRPDCIVALGGGSAMDCAKGINFVLTNGGRMADYHGFGKAVAPMLPSIGIPTTAGTGSEAQSFALISDADSHRKMACGDPQARFRSVILDPLLARTAPARVAAAAGLDAVSHAIESHVTSRHNPVSRMLSRHAWQLLDRHLETALGEGRPAEELGQVLLASHLAGAAIEQSMLGAAHAAANPLTARFGIAHGQAVALMLPHVIRYNATTARDGYLDLAQAANLDTSGGAGEAIASRVETLLTAADLSKRLADLDVPESASPQLAREAVAEWTARFNPVPVAESDFRKLYESAY